MKKTTIFTAVSGRRRLLMLLYTVLASASVKLHAQTLYVDAVNGKRESTGAIGDPLMSLEKAVELTHHFSGKEEVHIKLARGLYIISQKLIIKTGQLNNDVAPYIIEAMVMPDDRAWQPEQMPVVQSIAGVTDTAGFSHCIGLSIEKSNVSLLGLKFLGNPNSGVPDFYPVRRADKTLTDLKVSQCFFIGEANSAAIQSAFWVSGQGIHVDHCIFHTCKIAFVLGAAVDDFSLSYSIIDGAYNTAIWYGFAGDVRSFNFTNNIVANSNYFMVYPAENGQPQFTLRDSYITHNDHYLGAYPKAQDKFFTQRNRKVTEIRVKKNGDARFNTIQNDGMTHDYLNPSSGSTAKSTMAGLFKRSAM
jgi:hypothetical protein